MVKCFVDETFSSNFPDLSLGGTSLEEIREVKIPEDFDLLERFLMVDPIEFMPLILSLREKHFPKAYAGISEDSIKTLVTIEKEGRDITIWKGDVRFVSPILERWGPSKVALSVGIKHLHAVLDIYKPVKVFDEIFMMIVDKEDFRFKPKHTPKRLKSEELWYPGEKKAEIVYGIRVKGKIVSRGGVSRLIKDGPIKAGKGAFIFTDEEHQGKGYATSTLSYAIRDALKFVPIVTYLVESNITPAIRVLQKLGFRWHSAFLYTEVEKRNYEFSSLQVEQLGKFPKYRKFVNKFI